VPAFNRVFSTIAGGGALALSTPDMSQVELNDLEPGIPPEVRRIAGGALALIITIVPDHVMSAGAQLVVRWEPDGQLFAALLGAPAESEAG
jgi:hypothetical protein